MHRGFADGVDGLVASDGGLVDVFQRGAMVLVIVFLARRGWDDACGGFQVWGWEFELGL